MRSLDEILRLARQLPGPERRQLFEELGRLEQEETLSPEKNEEAWAAWVASGSQGPMEDDGPAWP